MNWKHNLENADGTRGPHFNMEQVMEAAKLSESGLKTLTKENFV